MLRVETKKFWHMSVKSCLSGFTLIPSSDEPSLRPAPDAVKASSVIKFAFVRSREFFRYAPAARDRTVDCSVDLRWMC